MSIEPNSVVGYSGRVWIVAELGINHNGSIESATQLIQAAADAGCDAVKLQKRTVDIVYSADELAMPRMSPFGATNGDLKRGLEFDISQYQVLKQTAVGLGLTFFASVWDTEAVSDMMKVDVPVLKIPSARLVDSALLRSVAATTLPVIASTGMASKAEIRQAVEALVDSRLVLLHSVSCYPTPIGEANLRKISTLQQEYPNIPVGYSGHDLRPELAIAAVAMGARVVEKHITLDRALWGSDQGSSLEPPEFKAMVEAIRLVEQAFGDGEIGLRQCEVPAYVKLRRSTNAT